MRLRRLVQDKPPYGRAVKWSSAALSGNACCLVLDWLEDFKPQKLDSRR
jgi:hypothetical protein